MPHCVSAVCREEDGAAASVLNGDELLKWLREAGLFVIDLDAQGEWFRFHHLFQKHAAGLAA